jgi:hypothetical protein
MTGGGDLSRPWFALMQGWHTKACLYFPLRGPERPEYVQAVAPHPHDAQQQAQPRASCTAALGEEITSGSIGRNITRCAEILLLRAIHWIDWA